MTAKPKILYFFIFIISNVSVLSLFSYPSKEVTQNKPLFSGIETESLGIPFHLGTYANNVWDMQLLNNRIYLGHGNSANDGPNPNAGPIPIIYFDTLNNLFVNEYTTEEEQIERFRIINGDLYIPGRDPVNNSGYGNLYRQVDSTWDKVSTIPNVLHTFDVTMFGKDLFAANGTIAANSLMRSTDEGRTWQVMYASPGRFYHLVELNGDLYALRLLSNTEASTDSVTVFDGSKFGIAGIPGSRIVPGAPERTPIHLLRLQIFRNQAVYVASSYDARLNDWIPFGLYGASSLNLGRRVTLPVADALPYDILVRGNTIYVLAASQQAIDQYTIHVFSSTDLISWSETLRFTADTFARSFEEADGAFYFGLGCNTDRLPESTGSILRVRVGSPPVSSTATATLTGPPTPTNTRTPTAIATPTRPPQEAPIATPSVVPRGRPYVVYAPIITR